MQSIEDKLDETMMHCAMAVGEIMNLKGSINAKKSEENMKHNSYLKFMLDNKWSWLGGVQPANCSSKGQEGEAG